MIVIISADNNNTRRLEERKVCLLICVIFYPTCKKALTIDPSHFFSSRISKQCPDGHYKKVSHPALETPIEIIKQ